MPPILEPVASNAKEGSSRASARILGLDVVRGFALFGILVANLAWNIQHYAAPYEALAGLPTTFLDYYASSFIEAVFQDKFYTLFAFLFGVGFALQIQRAHTPPVLGQSKDPTQTLRAIPNPTGTPSEAQSTGPSFQTRHTRRVVSLLILGLAHAILIWGGDILHMYALMAVPLWFCRHWATPALFAGAIVLILGSGWGVAFLSERFPGVPMLDALDWPSSWDDMIRARQEGLLSSRYTDVIRTHWDVLIQDYWKLGLALEYFPKILGRFLLGFAAVRVGFLLDTPRASRVRNWVLATGLPLNLACAFVIEPLTIPWESFPAWAQEIPEWIENGWYAMIHELGILSLSAFYLTALWQFTQRSSNNPMVQGLARVGRMPLTQYILQSGLYVGLFYGYAGLGLFGQVGTWVCLPIAMGFFLIQILFSRLWNRISHEGPLDALWKRWIYR